MRPPADGIATAALAAEDAVATYAAVVDAARVAFGADEAVLLRRSNAVAPAVTHRSPARHTGNTIDARELMRAAGSEPAGKVVTLRGERPVLGIGLGADPDTTWVLGLARGAGAAWKTADRERLAGAASSLALALLVAGLREQVAAGLAREAEAEGVRERSLAALSHELRNPLAPILMWTSTLKRQRPGDPEVLRGLQAIEHAVSLTRRLIEDLSDVSRLERGVIELRRERLDFRDTVRRAVDRSRGALADARLSLTEEMPAEPVPVDGDPVRLLQVVDNLIGNAVKFTPPDGSIAVRLVRTGKRAELRVSDSGPGLGNEVRPRLFMPFVQGVNARGGLGVGLAIARRIVQLHGGGIEALPEGDLGGTTIAVTIPLHASSQGARATG